MKRSIRQAHAKRAFRYARSALKSIAKAFGYQEPPIDLSRTSVAFGAIDYNKETGLFTHTHHPSDLCDCAVGYEGHADNCAAQPFLCTGCAGTGCCSVCQGDGTNGVPSWHRDEPFSTNADEVVWNGVASPKTTTVTETLVSVPLSPAPLCIVCRGFHYGDQHCAPPPYDK